MPVRKNRFVAVPLALAALTACATQAVSGPKGWQPKPGASAQWTNGAQAYSLEQHPYQGSLQDYASTIAINTALHNRGAKWQGSDIFQPCPGRAAIATFALPSGDTMLVAFAVQNGQSITVTYVRPKGSASDPAVADAMNQALCQSVM